MMRFGKILVSLTLLLASVVPGLAITRSRRGPTSPKLFSKRSRLPSKPSGQRAIDNTRATQIQTSLIGSGYLSGQASGHWDSETETAMQKYQSDNGWQTKLIPDSRAIIKLGLGPDRDPEASNTSVVTSHTASTSGLVKR